MLQLFLDTITGGLIVAIVGVGLGIFFGLILGFASRMADLIEKS